MALIIAQKRTMLLCLGRFDLPLFIRQEIVRITWIPNEINEYETRKFLESVNSAPFCSAKHGRRSSNGARSWNWGFISGNVFLSIDIIKSYPNIQWDWEIMSSNPFLTIDIIERWPIMQWKWLAISRNPAMTLDVIEHHLKIPWDWYDGISSNPNITLEFIGRHLDPFRGSQLYAPFGAAPEHWTKERPNSDKGWNWRNISANPGITMDVIEHNLHPFGCSWNWTDGIQLNPNLTLDFIERYPAITGLYDFTSQNDLPRKSGSPLANDPKGSDLLSASDPRRGSGNFWDVSYILAHLPITLDYIDKHVSNPTEWNLLMKNPNLMLEMIEYLNDRESKKINPDEAPNVRFISFWEEKAHWGVLLNNPHMTTAFIEKHIKHFYLCSMPYQISAYDRYFAVGFDRDMYNPNISVDILKKIINPSDPDYHTTSLAFWEIREKSSQFIRKSFML
jgi:hypothetical protein